MKRLVLSGLLGLALAAQLPSNAQEAAQPAPSTNGIDLKALLAKMSLDEKIGQMVQMDLGVVTVPNKSPIQLDARKLREALATYKISSFINNGLGHALSLDEWHSVNKTIQDMIRAETPNAIPLLYGIDSIHGATFVQGATLFPQNLGMAATRNPELMRRTAEIAAQETRAAGLRWSFAPVLDVGRQPLWARLAETFGEDPYLASVLGDAAVRGFQGTNLASPTSVAACMKHYVGYSLPLTGKDRSPALIPDFYLREYFLPPFQAATRAGVRTVMINSGEVNGIPVHASKYLLTDVLRGELGFQGVAVSDWEDVIRLHTWHKVAETPAEAVRLAVNAGLDMSMVPLDYSFFKLLKQLVQDGYVTEQRIDESVLRILRLKAAVGLFANPYVEPEAAADFGSAAHRQVALTAAEESITLLKNQNATLPLAKTAKVLVAGPAARSVGALQGCWSFTWQGKDAQWYPKSTLSIDAAFREKLGDASVLYRAGVDFDGKVIDVDTAVADAAKVDAVILCLGEDAYAETPGDINDLDLPAGQQELAKRLYATGKSVVLVLVEGRGRIIREIEPGAKGIVFTGWPGSEGARAIANVLFGDTNPSGKLPFTYARHANNLVTYDRKYTSRIAEISAPGESSINIATPQYEFGFGLSYTTFAFKNLRLSVPVLKGFEQQTVTVDVTNTGTRAGQEVVELYTRDLYASLTPPMRRLRAFQKISIEPGQTKTVTFQLSAEDLAFVNAASQRVIEFGDFEVMIGDLKAGFRYEY